MRSQAGAFGIFLLGGALLAASPAPAQDDTSVVEDVLAILKQRGIVDEAEYRRLLAKNASYQERHRFPNLELSGDFRGRVEGMWFDRDTDGTEQENRFRGRYRLRIAGRTRVNDFIAFHFRLASGGVALGEDQILGGDPRSANRTLGSGADFDPDGIFLDRAYLELTPVPQDRMPLPGGRLVVHAGKLPNPFRWKVARGFPFWDSDLAPEGVALRLRAKPVEALLLFGHAGYFVIQENSQAKDPHVFGLQLGGELAATETLTLGGRASWYSFGSLDPAFLARGASDGNLLDGLTGDPSGRGGLQAGELGGFVRYAGVEGWPVTLYGHVARNFDARDSRLFLGVGDEDLAFGLGVELGDAAEVVRLGASYWVIEANAWPAIFVDSDLFDEKTNRKGFAFYGSRRILPHTDLNLTVFLSDEIEDALAPFASSLSGAERIRVQTDLVVRF